MRYGLAIVALLGGCDLYIADDEPPYLRPDARPRYPDAQCDPEQQELRDPETGACFWASGCDPRLISTPGWEYWPLCRGACRGLDESTCLTTAGCNASYDLLMGTSTPQFSGCWQTAQTGPAPGSSCWYLGGAYGCSTHDDCAMYYGYSFGGSRFEYCGPEPVANPPTPCADLATESACTARSDCRALYTGTDCTCDATSCWCEHQTYARCEARP